MWGFRDWVSRKGISMLGGQRGQSFTQENSTSDVMKIEDHMESEGQSTAGDMELHAAWERTEGIHTK